jgi:hypothetical protein
VGAKFFHADGQTDRQTDMTKLIVSFSNFENAPYKPVTYIVTKYVTVNAAYFDVNYTCLLHVRLIFLIILFWLAAPCWFRASSAIRGAKLACSVMPPKFSFHKCTGIKNLIWVQPKCD